MNLSPSLAGLSRSDLEFRRKGLVQDCATATLDGDSAKHGAETFQKQLDDEHQEVRRRLAQESKMFTVVRVSIGTALTGLLMTVANQAFAPVIGLGAVGIVGGIMAMRWCSRRGDEASKAADQTVNRRDICRREIKNADGRLRRLQSELSQVEQALESAAPEAHDPVRILESLKQPASGILEQVGSVQVGSSRVRTRTSRSD